MIPLPSKLWLYGGVILAVLITVGVVYQKGKSAGQEQQKQENIADTKIQLEEMRKSAEAEFQKVATEARQEIQAAQARMAASERRESLLISSLSSIRQERQAGLETVVRTPDSELLPLVWKSLNLRSAQNDSPCLTFPEQRRVLEVLTDHPQLQKQTELLQSQVTEIREQVASLRQEVLATGKQVEAEAALRKRYAEFYTILWNATRQKKRGLKCLGLWKCSLPKSLSIPSPEALIKTP